MFLIFSSVKFNIVLLLVHLLIFPNRARIIPIIFLFFLLFIKNFEY